MEYDYIEEVYKELDTEMLTRIYEVVDEMGGEVEQIDLENKYIKINIDTEVEEEASIIVNDLIMAYIHKKKTLFKDNPFLMAQMIQKDLGMDYGNDEKN